MKVAKLVKKIRKYWLLKTNQTKFVKFLEIDTANPETIHIYGKVNFGTEPWIISMGKNVHITDGVRFITHDGGTLLLRDRIPDLELTAPIKLGDNVYIGCGAIVLPGVTIGSNVVIAAGAIVTKDIPSNEVWGGIPAKKIESMEDYIEKAKERSLHLGHLKGAEKDRELRRLFQRDAR